MAEGKGPLLRDSADISRLITGHAVNSTTDNSRSALHAYEVALKTTRDKCQKQAEQLKQLDDETRRLLADKTGLHAEIELLRENSVRQRERAGQLHRELAERHRECSALREQVALQSRQLQTARRRLEAAGLEAADLAPASIEQANRGSDEMHVQAAVVPADESVQADDISSMTEDEIARRLLELQQAGRHSLQDSFSQVVVGLQQAAVLDAGQEGGGVGHELRRLAQAIRRRSDVLRESVAQLARLRERGAVLAAPADGSLPPLQEIPLTGSPPLGRPIVRDGATDAPSGRWPAGVDNICPICDAIFRPPSTRAEFEDHVYAHVVDMTAEELPLESRLPWASSSDGRCSVPAGIARRPL